MSEVRKKFLHEYTTNEKIDRSTILTYEGVVNLLNHVYDNDIIKLETEKKEMLEALIESDETICRLCVIINPQHKGCRDCNDRYERVELIKKHKEVL